MNKQSCCMNFCQIVVVSALIILTTTSFAETLPFPPVQAEICTTTNVVDKEKLAGYLLKKYPLSVLALSAGSVDMQKPNPKQHLLAELLATPNICSNKCGSLDQQYLDSINGSMSQILAGSMAPSFTPSSQVDPWIYFQGINNDNLILCGVADGKPIEAPSAVFIAPPKENSKFRIRGNPSHLNIDRSIKTEFSATDKAIISFAGDNIAGTTTSRVVGYIGYAIPMSDSHTSNGNRLEVVPYLGINRNSVTSTTKTSRSSTANLGVLASQYIITIDDRGSALGHQIDLRPDYLADFEDGSRLFTLNVEYIPVKNGFINAFIPMSKKGNYASIKPMFSLKNNNGTYISRGNSNVANLHGNFVKIGARIGFVIVSDNPQIPLDFTSTYTKLSAISGKTNISYFKNALSYSFDQSKYFGIMLSNSHGIREDTGKNESLWELDLTARF